MIQRMRRSQGLTILLSFIGVLRSSRECEAIPNLGKPPEQILKDFDTRFGDSIAIHGGIALIGASEKNGKGSFYVYKEVPDAGVPWQRDQIVKFDPSFPGYGGSDSSSFGSAVALYQDVAVVGAPYLITDGNSDPYGAAFIFRRDVNGAFQLIADVSSSLVEFRRGGFGHAVAIGRNHIVISELDAGLENSYYSVGAVHVYSYAKAGAEGLGIEFVQTIFPPDPHVMTWFGSSIDIAGDTLVIGEEGRNTGAQGVGRAYTYKWNGVEFVLSNTLMPEQDLGSQHFGSAVAISADESTVVVGAKGDYQSQDRIGQAFAFDMDFLVPQRYRLVPIVGTITTADRYGASVAISSDGTYIVVGGPGLLKNGVCYAFNNIGQNMAVVKGLHDFGHAVAMSDDDHFLMVADLAGNNVDENIYVWRNESPRPPPTPGPAPMVTPSPTPVSTPPPTVQQTSVPTLSSNPETTDLPTTGSNPEGTDAPTPQPSSFQSSVLSTPGPTPLSEPAQNPTSPDDSTPAPSLRPGFNGFFSEPSGGAAKMLSRFIGVVSIGLLVLWA